jgi:hypothetical protein
LIGSYLLKTQIHPFGDRADVEHVGDGSCGLLGNSPLSHQGCRSTIRPDGRVAELLEARQLIPPLNKAKGRRYAMRRDTGAKDVVE